MKKVNAFITKDLNLKYVQTETTDGYVIRTGYINSPTVKVGDIVPPGQVIGVTGSLQNAYPPNKYGTMTDHIHVGIKHNGVNVNPQILINTP